MTTQQKGIEDYRNAVKLLKMKVIKLQKLNEDLNEKLREQGLPVITDDKNSQGTLTNQNSMQAFSRGCKRLGLSPEMLFRASDLEGTGSIKVEDFRLFMSRVRLGLNQSQVTLIVRILDEDCSGIVNKEEYYDCLQAYGINEEKSNTGTRTYGQISLLKYSKLLLQAQMSPEDSWSRMDSANKGTIIPSTFSNFVHAFDSSGQLNEKEIVATFNHIDLDKQGTIQKFFYEQEIRKAMKATASDLGITTSNVFAKTTQSFNIPIPQNSGNLETLRPQTANIPINKSKTLLPPSMDQSAVNESFVVMEEKRLFEPDTKGMVAIISKLQAQGINIINFIEKLMDKLVNPAAGVMLYDVYQGFESTKVLKSDQLQLFHILDIGGNGSIDYDELMYFFLSVKKQTDKFDVLFKILTRKLQADEIDIVQYLSIEQVYEQTKLSIDEFFPIAEILFNVQNRQTSDDLYKSMDSDGCGSLSAQEIIDAVRAILEIYCPPKILTLNIKNQDSEIDLDQYQKILRKLKPVLTDDDFFDKRTMRGKKVILKKWKTILNSDLACLKFCYDLILELDKTPGLKWSDPEFGSTPTDQYGSKSMYFADNDIVKGCPDPKEVQWLRPEEVVATLVDKKDKKYKGQIVELFAKAGAGANDVVQSDVLGNCWFISALSIIARYDKYLQGEFIITAESLKKDLTDQELAGFQFGVYPPCFQFLVKYGIYVMRFYKNFGWRYVVIDDRLCFKGDSYVYGQCRRPTENWVNMIEKAYAKIHGCYDALTSGDIAQGLADMTGLAADRTKFDGKTMTTVKQKDDLWLELLDSKESGTMMGCSAEGDTEGNVLMNEQDTGIMSGHAYSLIDVFELPDKTCKNYHKSHRLLLLRNPWGRKEWLLKWSENPDHPKGLPLVQKFSKEIDQYYDKEIAKAVKNGEESPERYQTDSQADDGMFLIGYKDWRRIFCNLFQCIKFPKDWSGIRAIDNFPTESSGVPKNTELSQINYAMKNPQYIFDLDRKDGKKETVVWVQFKQIDGRLYWAEKYPFTNIMRFVLLCVFKLAPGETHLTKFDKSKMIATSGSLNLRREIDSDRMTLANGKYAIIPCTKDPGEQVRFSCSIYHDCSHEEIKIQKFRDPSFKFNIIEEEEETFNQVDDNLKKLFKKQAEDVLAYQSRSQIQTQPSIMQMKSTIQK